MSRTLSVQPLTKEAFAPFGEVIETEGARHWPINYGYAERYNDLAKVDVLQDEGRPLINIYRATPWPQPIRLKEVERHPLSSQAFVPLTQIPFLIVVAKPGNAPGPEDLRAFMTSGQQGINLSRGVWHHPLLALKQVCDFVVVERGGTEKNCDIVPLGDYEIDLGLPQSASMPPA
jgi:ureidoglycolate lyase